MKRIFIGINFSEEIRQEIYEILSKEIDKKDCKIVKPENIHITLKFLGYLDEKKIVEIKKAIRKLAPFNPFLIELNGIGHFKGQVIWIDIKKGKDAVIEINSKINEFLELEKEDFHPHVTLARNKYLNRTTFDDVLNLLNNKKYDKQVEVKSIDLMESVLTPNGPKYEIIQKIELGKATEID